MKVTPQNKVFFYLFLLFVIYITYLLLRPYLGVVVFSVVTVVVFQPLYELILGWVGGRKGLATTVTILAIILAVLIPVLIVVNITINQAVLLVQDVSSVVAGENSNLTTAINRINEILATVPYAQNYQIDEASVLQAVRKMAGPVANFAAGRAVSLGSASVEWITDAIIFLAVVGTLLPSYHAAGQLLQNLSPLPDELDRIYIDRFVAMTKAMVKGIFVIAVVQGIVAGIFMAVAGTWYVFFLTLLAIFAAVLPLGVNILTVPVGIVHFFLGNTWQGILIIAGSLLVVSQLDNLLRPRLVSKDAYLNPALVLLSAFGGLSLFGFLGVIYGPIIMIFFVTTIEIYLEHYKLSPRSFGASKKTQPSELETGNNVNTAQPDHSAQSEAGSE
ncbi:MAG: AI-2E family transporter [Anaerolineae bacterium]|nr:AI-2E family transporter [Anaerolineae bacterium]